MSVDDDIPDANVLWSRFKDFIAGIGRRIAVHLAAMFVGGLAAAMAGDPKISVGCYVGLVCLFPRGPIPEPDWLIPTGFGLSILPIWSALGVPWQFSIPFAGGLTWLIRLLIKKGIMGWEWAALPWLMLALFGAFSNLPPSAGSLPLWSLPLLAALAYCSRYFYGQSKKASRQQRLLLSNAAKIKETIAAKALPEPLKAPLDRLGAQCLQLVYAKKILANASATDLLQRVETFTDNLLAIGATPNQNRLDSVLMETVKLNAAFAELLKDQPDTAKQRSRNDSTDPAKAPSPLLEAYSASGLQLLQKLPRLPKNLQNHVRGIQAATEKILHCMRNDPEDLAPGGKFLDRYLAATHKVVDEYIRLSGQNTANENVAKALARTGELLSRLEKAFNDEHGRLLQNDALNFTAELNTLDTLLKMQGR